MSIVPAVVELSLNELLVNGNSNWLVKRLALSIFCEKTGAQLEKCAYVQGYRIAIGDLCLDLDESDQILGLSFASVKKRFVELPYLELDFGIFEADLRLQLINAGESTVAFEGKGEIFSLQFPCGFVLFEPFGSECAVHSIHVNLS